MAISEIIPIDPAVEAFCRQWLGEAAGKLSGGLRARYQAVAWKDIRGMRNHLIHRYDKIDLAEV
jgi:uncharacterized protein with HEPN domain